MIGLALVLRDLAQRRLGIGWAISAIAIGTVLSATFAPTSLVIASAAAFFVSEFADLGVYTPLQRRGMILAVVLSSVAGLVVDSIVFLWLAFGSLAYLPGQILAKAWMVPLALPIIAWLKAHEERVGAMRTS